MLRMTGTEIWFIFCKFREYSILVTLYKMELVRHSLETVITNFEIALLWYLQRPVNTGYIILKLIKKLKFSLNFVN